jgi:hypothetical protein
MMLNVRKESSGATGQNPSTAVPFVKNVHIINVNRSAAKNHTENYNSYDDGNVIIGSHSCQQTV